MRSRMALAEVVMDDHWRILHALPGDGEKTKDGALARVEIAKDELAGAFEVRDAIVLAGKRLGFSYVTLDLQGYRTGSHNEVLAGRQLKIVG